MSRRTASPVAPTSAASPVASAPATEDNVLRFDEAPEFSFRQHDDDSMDDMEQQVKEAQHRLAALRAQQEEVERQKQILEALRQKQDRFVTGKKEVTEKIERALRSIMDELDEARRRVEDLAVTQKDFEDRLNDLKTYLPERWQRSQLDYELDRALNSLDDAETSYEKGVRRLLQHRPSVPTDAVAISPIHAAMSAVHEHAVDVQAAGEAIFATSKDDLLTWVRRGFAFNAALIATLVVLLILARLMF
jgi:molecular chaperone GrpE (heat shock protein)